MDITQVLYEYDCEPLSHVREDDLGNKFYCHVMISGIYAIVPVSDQDLDNLLNNRIDIISLFKNRKTITVINDIKNETREYSFEELEPGLPKDGVKFNKD